MPSTYTLISSNVLGSSAASVTFSAIPSTYTDLVLRVSARNTSTTTITRIRLNGATSGYSGRSLTGDGTTASSQTQSTAYLYSGELNTSSTTANTFTSMEFYLPNYLSTVNKPVSTIASTENNATAATTVAFAGLSNITSAITSIEVYVSTNAFDIGSSFYLYGISKS
jgi:hypothetical protein